MANNTIDQNSTIPFLPDPIAFGDLRRREEAERKTLFARLQVLNSLDNKRPRTPEEEAERIEIQEKLATDDVVDPLFKAVQLGIAPDVGDHKKGLLPSQQAWQALLAFIASGKPLPEIGDTLINLVGLDDYPKRDELASAINESVANLPRGEIIALLKPLAVLFDKYVATIGDPKKNPATELEALAAGIEASANNSFGNALAEAVRENRTTESEALVDLGLALAEANPSNASRLPDVRIELTDDEKLLAAVFGILEADNQEPPAYHLPAAKPAFDPSEARRKQQFGKALFTAQGEYVTNKPLFEAVLPILVKVGEQGPQDQVLGEEWAGVVRNLISRGIDENEPQLARKVDEALNSIQNVGDNLPPSLIGIDLPDLEDDDTTNHEIIEDNVRALQPAYFSAMFEELKVYEVLNKLLEFFQNGILPIGKGAAGDALFTYWKETATRVSESERRSFYARTLGLVGGDDGGMPNREFSDLWMRFVSGVSSFIRQNNVDDLLRTKIPGAISQQQVRKAGRDLAANLSLHGFGMAHFMATELQKQIKDAIKILSDDDIKNAYGARDMWQVIDQVAALELGGAKNSVRYRTMATSGAIIIAWLADRSRDLSSPDFGPILDIEEIRNPDPLPPGTKATTHPRDFDLVNACEQWLAVTGTQEEQVEDYAQPKETPNMTSKPIQIPAIARDMLESVGVPAMGLGGNGTKRY